MERRKGSKNNHGVALLIALLVTTLLMALVVEFAYATRISFRAAVNFRDSQRAYFLARSGVNFAGKILAEYLKNDKLRDNLEQREWQVVPIVSGGDTELRVRWEDEGGKINIANTGPGQPSLVPLEKLFGLPTRRVDLEVLDRMKEKRTFRILDELHQVMSDEEFGKIRDAVSVYAPALIDVNTASSDVLQSIGLTAGMAAMIVEKVKREPFIKKPDVNAFLGQDFTMVAGMLDVTSNTFLVHSYATVGGYTKQAEAVIILNPTGGFSIRYWKIL